MTQAPTPSAPPPASVSSGKTAAEVPTTRRGGKVWRGILHFFTQSAAPNWLQAGIIVALFGAAIFVALDGRYLWGTLLGVAGGAFGLAFVLRRMVGDEYGRS